MKSLSLKKGTGIYLSGAIAILSLLAASWLLAGVVTATSAPEIEIERSHTSLVASATAAGSEINGYSWKWIVVEGCSADLFSDFDASQSEKGTGWIVSLEAGDGGKHYCFYVEDIEGVSATASVAVAKPLIAVEQNNDQLVARVSNAAEEGFTVDEDSWQWYRYSHVKDSGFGCDAELFNLDDAALQQVAESVQPDQEEAAAVYETQKAAYVAGSGASVNLSEADEAMNFCFKVADTSGISNVGHITVGKVAVSAVNGEKSSADANTGQALTGEQQTGVSAAGEVGANSDDDSVVVDEDLGSSSNGDSNTIRNIGFGLLVVSLILAAWMIIKRSQNTDDEEA